MKLQPVDWATTKLSGNVLLFCLLAVELLALFVIQLPVSMDFDQFAFSDTGANFTIQHLVALGLRPGIDFGDPYGLLPILVGKIWFSLFGATPIAYEASMVACGLIVVWALARIATSLRFGTFGIALLFISLGFAVQASYPNIAQILESALIALALSAHSRGHRSAALAYACAGLFCKPSMSYVYGLVLIILVANQLLRSRASILEFVRAFAPAAITGVVLIVVLASMYSPASLVRTLFPLQGISTYRGQDFGFFHGSGRRFWDPPDEPWVFYFIDLSGFWIASSVFLMVSGAFAWTRWRRAERDAVAARRDEIVWTAAILHLAFVCFFFGNQWSWIYYAFILLVGVSVAADLSPLSQRLAIVLCLLGLTGWIDRGWLFAKFWRERVTSPLAVGLWSQPDEVAEWRHARAIVRGQRTVMLETKGSAGLMFPEFAPPVALYLDPGLMLPSEIRRQVQQLASAAMVVVPVGCEVPTLSQGIPKAPEILRAMDEFEPIWAGKCFEVYRRRAIATQLPSASSGRHD